MRIRTRRRQTATAFRPLTMESLEPRTLLTSGIGVFEAANDRFSLRNEPTAGSYTAGQFRFATPGSTPVVGDWNGDGKDDFGIFDSTTATWYLRYGAETGPANAGEFAFGSPGSMPIVGDWNGDGRDDIGTFKGGAWQLRYGASPGPANAGVFQFGSTGDQPVAGDWNGDGTDGIGVFNKSDRRWTLRQTASATAPTLGAFSFGPGDGIAVTGDWNGDGRDGIGVVQPRSAKWTLRQTASSGAADAGTFNFGPTGAFPITGDFRGPAAIPDALATVVLPPLDLDLLGLEVRTSPITVVVSAHEGDGKLLGNLLNTVSTLVNLDDASDAINQVLDSTVDLLNTAKLNVNAGSGPLDTATASAAQVLELFVAPVHLDLLGVQVDTSTIRVTITAKSGTGLILGNAVTSLINLFNPPLPETLSLDFLNQKLDELLGKLNQQLPLIAPAPVPPVPISDGQILNVTVPPLDLNLLGLVVETSPITVNASAETGNGELLGNVLTTALNTIDATPQNLSELNTNINGILAKVVGVLNSADLSLAAGAVDLLPPLLQTLLRPTLTAPSSGATAPILDLMIASTDGVSPPVNVDLLGLVVTTSNIEAHVSAQTGTGAVLGNLLYNLANLADPGAPAGLLNLLNLLGTGSLNDPGTTADSSVTPSLSAPDELLTISLKPINLNLLGLELHTDPIVVNVSTQAGDGKLLGNLLAGITTLINVQGVNNAIDNVLSTTIDLLNSTSLIVNGVGSGTFDTAPEAVTPVLDVFVAPVHLDLLGLVAVTEPIHLTLTSRSGQGRVLGNVVTELANLFNPPLPDRLNIDFVNDRLSQLITRLNQQIPGIPPAPVAPVVLEPQQFLELTVPPLDVDLLGLLLQTSPITVNAFATSGNGLLLGNVLTTVLNTVDATTENLTGLSNNLNALLAKVVGVLNASELVLPVDPLAALPGILQTLASPTLVTSTPGASSPILDLTIASNSPSGPPVDVDLLGLEVSTSNIDAQLLAQTGDGKVLGNLVYNVAHLLNPNGLATLLSLLSQLGRLHLDLSGTATFQENGQPLVFAAESVLSNSGNVAFDQTKLTVTVASNASIDDRLSVRNQGTAAGQIGVSGADITFGGIKIGTLAGGLGKTPLVISLNANVSLASLEALARNITFRNVSEAPDVNTRSIQLRVVDGAGGTSNPASKFVQVIAVNDAPILNNAGNPTLLSIAEDATNTAGTLVKDIVGNSITDPDAGALKGIAIIAAPTTNGNWQFTLDGRTWTGIGTTSATSAVLLPADNLAKVRFVPAKDFNGTVSMTYRAWDRTQGSAGARLNTTGNIGGTKSLSTATESASLQVTPVNDAPVLTLSGTLSYKRNDDPILLATGALVKDIDSANFEGGELRVRITTGAAKSNHLEIGGGLTVDRQNNVKYGTVTLGKLLADGEGTNDLAVSLSAQATPDMVQLLVRAITFKTKGGGTGTRSVVFSLSDGDGALSVPQTVTVNVR